MHSGLQPTFCLGCPWCGLPELPCERTTPALRLAHCLALRRRPRCLRLPAGPDRTADLLLGLRPRQHQQLGVLQCQRHLRIPDLPGGRHVCARWLGRWVARRYCRYALRQPDLVDSMEQPPHPPTPRGLRPHKQQMEDQSACTWLHFLSFRGSCHLSLAGLAGHGRLSNLPPPLAPAGNQCYSCFTSGPKCTGLSNNGLNFNSCNATACNCSSPWSGTACSTANVGTCYGVWARPLAAA